MSQQYFARRIRDLTEPITAFREYVFQSVLPQFDNINERAEQIGNEYYQRVLRRPVGPEDSIEISDLAEEATEHSLAWYSMMSSLGQSMRNLLTAGLFHLVEQQLASISTDGIFRNSPIRNTGLSVVATWYKHNLRVDMKSLPTWHNIDELRLVANTVKHGDGASANELRKVRPDLFIDPEAAKLLQTHAAPPIIRHLVAPLSGDEFFVTDSALREYAAHAENFFQELAAELERRTSKE